MDKKNVDGDDEGKGLIKSNSNRKLSKPNEKLTSSSKKSKQLLPGSGTKKKSTSYVVSWILSVSVAFSLFQTFTYQPPLHDESVSDHGHHHPAKLLINAPARVVIGKEQAPKQPEQQAREVPRRTQHDQTLSTSQKQEPSPPHDNGVDQPAQKSSSATSAEERTVTKRRTLLEVLHEAKVYDSLSSSEITSLPSLEKTFTGLYGPWDILAEGKNRSDVDKKDSDDVDKKHKDDEDHDNDADDNDANAISSDNVGWPVIYGMETCEAFRQLVPSVRDRYTAPAGMFDTGTNNLQYLLQHNLDHPIKALYQVPWGKHRMEARRLHHSAPGAKDLDQTQCLPVVIVRDPYHWMQSMCKSPYAAHWKHSRKRCPNLVVSPNDQKKFKNVIFDTSQLKKNKKDDEDDSSSDDAQTFQIKITFDEDDVEFFDSLVDVWNDWYRPYWENKENYPRLIVRFEDLLLHAPVIIEKVSECIFGPDYIRQKRNFKYQTSSSKSHGSGTNFLKAIMKTANETSRESGLTLKDKIYAAQHLDAEMMNAFQYRTVTE